jgi:hypothetical protein
MEWFAILPAADAGENPLTVLRSDIAMPSFSAQGASKNTDEYLFDVLDLLPDLLKLGLDMHYIQ